jgi:hypothetical protein
MVEGRTSHCKAGVVHHDVESSELAGRRGDRLNDTLLGTELQLDLVVPDPKRRQFACDLREIARAATGERDGGSGSGKGERELPSDAMPSSRDERFAARKTEELCRDR